MDIRSITMEEFQRALERSKERQLRGLMASERLPEQADWPALQVLKPQTQTVSPAPQT